MGSIESITSARRTAEREAQRRSTPDMLAVLALPGSPPALATDETDRVVFWNRGAAELLGRSSAEALGRRCFDVLGGHDVYGNRFCYQNCPVKNAVASGEPVSGFILDVARGEIGRRSAHATILPVPGARPGEFLIVHILDRAAPAAAAPRQPTSAPPLTAREREILQGMASGLQNKEVAQRLGISPATVRNHVHNILEKLGVHSKLEAVSLAFRNDWIKSDSTPSC